MGKGASIMTHPARHKWTEASVATLRLLYPHHTSDVVAKAIGCGIIAVYQKAHSLGLRKTPEFLSSQLAGRIQRPAMVANRFQPGMTPWNKGKRFDSGGNSHATRFKPGRPPSTARNYKPIGSLRISKDGYLERKLNDTHPTPARRWEAVHRLVWQAAHGPIPPGWIVVFKPGMRTAVEADITANRLECITRAEHAHRNHPRTKHPELGRLVQLKGAITRQVNRINREHNEHQGHAA